MAILVNPIAHLKRVIAWGNEPEHPVMGAPFAIDAYGQRWIVGSCLQFAVAVHHADDDVRALEPWAVGQVREALFPLLPDSGRAPGSSLASLKEWCGPVEWPVAEPCPDCKGGAGRAACAFCDGVGTMIPVHEERPGWIGEVLIDRAFLAWVLEPFDDVHVAVCSRGPRAPLNIIGKGWIVTVMPRVDHLAQQNAPHLLVLAEPGR